MASDILVSVILPVYNAALYLEKCLTSICQQTLQQIEILVINDGSTDDSFTIVQQFAQADPRIHVLNQQNSGVSKARNVGLEQATGHYVTFVDADDWLERTMLEELYTACQTTGLAIAKCDLYWQEIAHCRKLHYTSQVYQLYSAMECLTLLFTEKGEKHFGFVSCKLYQKSFLDEHTLRFDEEMCFAEDALFMMNVLIHSQAVCYVPKQLYYYNVANQCSLTRGQIVHLQEKYNLLYQKMAMALQKTTVTKKVRNHFLYYQLEGLLVILHQSTKIKEDMHLFLKSYPDVLKVKGLSGKRAVFVWLLKMKCWRFAVWLIALNRS
ncbi:glycosyltransferase family 2 protein [Lysinibacillus piscis]|uniref:Glycosyl transferase n=1 Tax=Lysinibacillus piscis TaxID=2518931 RepID=A0ABQ5NFZ8_9BACI|nr:glycosyltransferase [Lysinibacillus sp. KH24]GLC87315.1 glycosyl transferase [Lysinibacillus sp. KH24]